MPLTKYLFLLFLILLASVGRILLDSYLASYSFYSNIPSYIHVVIGLLIAISIYYLIFRVLTHMSNISTRVAFVPTALVFFIQIVRTVIYYVMGDALTTALYPLMISLISFYLFFIGFSFYKGIDKNWNYALQLLIKKMGLLTMFFAPISAVLYISFSYF